VDLDFSDEQEALRSLARDLCSDLAAVDSVRAMEDDPKGYTDAFWKALGEVGLIGAGLPEEHGGSAQSMIETAIVYEEFGRSLAPSPHFASAVVSAGALLAAGSDAQQRDWLPEIASGTAILAPAWLEPDSGFGPKGVQLRAVRDGDALLLSGRKRHVPFASSAQRLLVLARTGDALEAIDLLLVDPTTDGVVLTQQKSLASDTQYQVDFRDVRVPLADSLGGQSDGRGWQAWDAVMLDSVIALAASAIGGASRALEMTLQYAKDREQFGKPIGAFQSIAHYLADAHTRVEGGRTLVYQAAWARAEGRSTAELAPMAKLIACQTYRDLTAMCQQVWGGVGFTVEYDIQLYFRRAKQLQLSWWDRSYLEERIARVVLD
jgi:alkylation response protein AidB-like acyl-CoA dehydrogenase